MNIKIIYEDNDLLVVEKPAGIIVYPENTPKMKTLIDLLIESHPELKNTGTPPRYGIVHRLDKDTSGIILVAKNKNALMFLQKQFKERKATKRYLALVNGVIKEDKGKIETLIGRSPKNRKKQKVYLYGDPNSEKKRQAKTFYRVIERFKKHTLLEIEPKTGRKHQIRCHLAWMHHPIVGDKLYGFKDSPSLSLDRHFLHASYLKIILPSKKEKEFKSDLPSDLRNIIKTLKENGRKN